MLDKDLREHLEWVTAQKKPPEDVSLTEILSQLDRYTATAKLPERLHHYLTRRSYLKALEWLDDPDIPHRL